MKNNNNGNRPKTPEYKLRANHVHGTLKTLCYTWIKNKRPEVLAQLRRHAKKIVEVARG